MTINEDVQKKIEEYILLTTSKAELQANRTIDVTDSEAKIVQEYIKQSAEISKAEIDSKNQLKNRICQYACTILESGVRVLSIIAGVAMFNAGMEFEKEGSYTTLSMKNIVSKGTNFTKF